MHLGWIRAAYLNEAVSVQGPVAFEVRCLTVFPLTLIGSYGPRASKMCFRNFSSVRSWRCIRRSCNTWKGGIYL